MTVQQIIERAKILSSDTDPSGHSAVWFLAILDNFSHDLYEFIIRWKLQNIPGFTRTRLAFSTDSEGKYALPVDHFITSELWLAGGTQPIKASTYSQLSELSSNVFNSNPVWAIYNGYWYIKPAPTVGVVGYYYPQRSVLALTDTWPGGGMLDNIAVEYIYSRAMVDDREAKYDVNVDLNITAGAMLRARRILLGSEPKVILPNVAAWG